LSDIIQSFADVIPGSIRKEFERELITGWRMQEAASYTQAKQFAAFNHANEAKSIDGVGELKARIPISAYHYWGTRLGYECWNDKSFVDDYIKHNPEIAIHNRMKRTQVRGAIFTADGFLT
jgi:glycine cleavage system pyridoxal-binding protein P